jgi:hypothetical protein
MVRRRRAATVHRGSAARHRRSRTGDHPHRGEVQAQPESVDCRHQRRDLGIDHRSTRRRCPSGAASANSVTHLSAAQPHRPPLLGAPRARKTARSNMEGYHSATPHSLSCWAATYLIVRSGKTRRLSNWGAFPPDSSIQILQGSGSPCTWSMSVDDFRVVFVDPHRQVEDPL